ncbi:enoyl-CoA hydratase [Futiania mangrovi]|uniref:Enoyl-CoA hydratase domain-containing protein 3, mitochondrial n=1 Tax=Futiania mangrovi TaxID=2959716 RepID=A0A9J6PAI0_9PROT|nr:enoyl-CoA hydratase [Futiania mangrovii]
MSTASMAADSKAAPVFVRETREGPVYRITLANAAARNALSRAAMDEISAALTRAAEDADARVVVIGHEGPAFSAGHDLKEMQAARRSADGGRAFYDALFAQCSDMMMQVVRCPKPVIAEVDGVASAAGCQLVASCDLAYASETSRFATPGVNIGLFCSTPMVALTRNVARKHAMEMLLTGEMIGADEAQAIGLLNRAVPQADLSATVRRLAETIASKSPLTLKTGKEAFYVQAEMGLADAYAYTARVMAENMMARDANEGIGAFVEKRPPTWTGS